MSLIISLRLSVKFLYSCVSCPDEVLLEGVGVVAGCADGLAEGLGSMLGETTGDGVA